MLTNATEENRVPTMGSFIPLFNKHGFMTCFYSRQNKLGRSGHLTDALIGSSKDIRYFSSPTDQDLLKETEPLFKTYQHGLLLLLHTTGSHYDYRGNYTETFKVFAPDEYTPESMMEHRQNVINAYDNTIVKTDDFLAKLYAQLKDHDAIVVYVSDHGQLLGEHGRFLHAIGGTGTKRMGLRSKGTMGAGSPSAPKVTGPRRWLTRVVVRSMTGCWSSRASNKASRFCI